MKSDNEIIKALNEADGLYHTSIYCGNRKGEHIASIKMTDIIDLINRQKAEVENQSYNFKQLTAECYELQKTIEKLTGQIRRLQEANKQLCNEVDAKELDHRKALAEIERLQSYKVIYENLKAEYNETIRCIKNARAEAIKEFEKALRIEISEAIKSNRRAKQQRINRLNEKGVVCNDEFCSYCDGKIHALCGIGEFIDNLVKEKVGDAE